jgi:hypothetical protein
MRQKTYLTPGQQWDRTVSVAKTCPYTHHSWPNAGLGGAWHLGQIVQPHSLFCVGDFVVIHISNGQAQRFPVWGMSSKGRVVKALYLNYQEHSTDRHKGGSFIWRAFRKPGKAPGWVLRKIKKKCRRSLRLGYFAQGPLRFVEVPEHLTGVQPDAPPLRQHIVALAREGWRTPDKRE